VRGDHAITRSGGVQEVMASRLSIAGARGYPGTPWTDPDRSLTFPVEIT
jgi:hypothetical protein